MFSHFMVNSSISYWANYSTAISHLLICRKMIAWTFGTAKGIHLLPMIFHIIYCSFSPLNLISELISRQRPFLPMSGQDGGLLRFMRRRVSLFQKQHHSHTAHVAGWEQCQRIRSSCVSRCLIWPGAATLEQWDEQKCRLATNDSPGRLSKLSLMRTSSPSWGWRNWVSYTSRAPFVENERLYSLSRWPIPQTS